MIRKHKKLKKSLMKMQTNDIRKFEVTGGPPLTRKLLTRFPLPRFFAYVRVSGGISVSRGPQYSPTNTNFM